MEKELEVLYDAYYEDLEQYVNYQQRYISSDETIPPLSPFPGSVEVDKAYPTLPHQQANSNFSLCGPGNILTVADDLLKNDDRNFLKMMEQLAERRMADEESKAKDSQSEEADDRKAEEDDEEDEQTDEEDEDTDEDEEDEDKDEDEEDEVRCIPVPLLSNPPPRSRWKSRKWKTNRYSRSLPPACLNHVFSKPTMNSLRRRDSSSCLRNWRKRTSQRQRRRRGRGRRKRKEERLRSM